MNYEEIINREVRARVILLDYNQELTGKEANHIGSQSSKDDNQKLWEENECEKKLTNEWHQEYKVIYQSYILEN